MYYLMTGGDKAVHLNHMKSMGVRDYPGHVDADTEQWRCWMNTTRCTLLHSVEAEIFVRHLLRSIGAIVHTSGPIIRYFPVQHHNSWSCFSFIFSFSFCNCSVQQTFLQLVIFYSLSFCFKMSLSSLLSSFQYTFKCCGACMKFL